MNEIMIFNNKDLDLKVRTILNADGSISINAEDAAIGFGWAKTEIKNKKEYTSIRWERVNEFSRECGFAHEWSKEDYIPESLFYMLGMKANNKIALDFQKWLAIKILPSIRQNGGYIAGQEKLTDIELMAQAVIVAQKTINNKNLIIANQQEQLEEQSPKVEFADAISGSKTSILVGDMAKLLKQNDIDIGEKRLFKWLRENKYVSSRAGESYNLPTQKSIELGIMEYKESVANGIIYKTPVITSKGQKYFVKKFLEDKKKSSGFEQINLAISIF